jgi:nicotinamidase-related amidase
MMSYNHTIDVDDSILILIDVQDYFLKKFAAKERDILIGRIAWLVDIATRMGVPILATAEDMPTLGEVTEEVAKRIPQESPILSKLYFDLTREPHIFTAIKDIGRKTLILTGLETDVCVAQSAMGLLREGFSVAVVADATGSPGAGHEFGIQRVRDAGVAVLSLKGLYYEWIRTAKNDREFMERYLSEIGSPSGIYL